MPKPRNNTNRESPHTLYADDGSVLKAKEPVVLDREGNPVSGPSEQAQYRTPPGMHVFRLGWPMGILLLLLLPVLLVGGFLVFAVVAAALLLLWSLRAITRALLGR